MMAIYILLWIVNIWCLLTNRNNKYICVLTYGFMGLLFISNMGTYGDAYSYKIDFENQVFLTDWTEMGYQIFKNTLYQISINTYFGLLVSIFVFCTVISFFGLAKFKCSYHGMIAMIMPFIFPTCSVAIRFFMAISIVLLSLRFLIKRNYFIYIMLIFLATLFHRSVFIYLILIVCTSNKIMSLNKANKLLIKIIFAISLLCLIYTYIGGSLPFIDSIVRMISFVFPNIEVKIQTYTTSVARLGSLIFYVIYFAGLFFAYIVRKSVYVENGLPDACENSTKELCKMADLNFNIHIVLSILLPFLALNLIYYRLLIIAFVSDAILFGMYIKEKKTTKSLTIINTNKVYISFLAICILWFIPEMIGINGITIQGIFDASFFVNNI